MQFMSDALNPFRVNGEEIVYSPAAAARYARAGFKSDFVHHVGTNRTDRGIGDYPSLAMQVAFPYFSSLELALLRYLDLAIGARFWPQPVRFDILIDGTETVYTPDCGVLFEGRRIMVETKFKADADSEENRRRWPFIQAELQSAGYDFLLIDENFLHEETLADRLEAIQRFRRFDWDELASFQLESRLTARECWRLDEVLAEIAALNQHEDMFFASVMRRKIYVDLHGPIDEATEVFPARSAPFPLLFRD
jgi:hypothetical protein